MKIKLLIVALISQVAISQHRSCGMKEYMQQIMSDPQAREQYLKQQELFKAEYQRVMAEYKANKAAGIKRTTNATLRIPVAVHYPSATTATAAVKTCLRNFAQNQINILNADYNATNADISNWAGVSDLYPGTQVGDLDVEFVLATQNHPAGTGLVNGEVAVTFGTDFLNAGNVNCTNGCNDDTTWAGYMNFVVKNITGGILGFSPLGGSPNGGHAVVMDNNAFASGAGCTGYVPGAPYNLGRTVTHELGHFFNLDHTFANDNGCGSDDDGIADTPKTGYATYDCPADGSVAGCVPGEFALTMNYMDYVNDACMYMFTEGQRLVMLSYLNVIKTQYNSNTLSTPEVAKSRFSVYPNPNKGSFSIQFEEVLSDFSVQVVDQSGRVVLENDYAANNNMVQTIDLNTTATGVYFVTVKSDNSVTTKKVIVQ
ncbi:zinc-dependent metalloprotease [Flavobacterium sp. SM15]|uniref:zinc-dependent metalloprotease n=1 Tax=Flavobacterium sp. SM15 TaxID=2908005 RepID=UPI001EDB5859|nr:zinc-dependent metalloprotease [Flavobacterium sp. SM15]MCG2611365.1 zinc-dependent metalloprotease [Flavobacterium sp. SM15]